MIRFIVLLLKKQAVVHALGFQTVIGLQCADPYFLEAAMCLYVKHKT